MPPLPPRIIPPRPDAGAAIGAKAGQNALRTGGITNVVIGTSNNALASWRSADGNPQPVVVYGTCGLPTDSGGNPTSVQVQCLLLKWGTRDGATHMRVCPCGWPIDLLASFVEVTSFAYDQPEGVFNGSGVNGFLPPPPDNNVTYNVTISEGGQIALPPPTTLYLGNGNVNIVPISTLYQATVLEFQPGLLVGGTFTNFGTSLEYTMLFDLPSGFPGVFVALDIFAVPPGATVAFEYSTPRQFACGLGWVASKTGPVAVVDTTATLSARFEVLAWPYLQ